jgi:hypothetical protein
MRRRNLMNCYSSISQFHCPSTDHRLRRQPHQTATLATARNNLELFVRIFDWRSLPGPWIQGWEIGGARLLMAYFKLTHHVSWVLGP